jgi:prepilin-type N-terminal cleavage/methylation domain-containing protein
MIFKALKENIHMFLHAPKQKGFTLIEMAVVIAVIGTLTAMAMVQTEGVDKNTEEALLEDYLQKLNAGAATYLENTGQSPNDFSQFMAVNQAGLDPDNNILVPLLYNRDNVEMCGTAVPASGSTILTCNGTGLVKRQAIYTLTAGMISIAIFSK